MSSITVSSCCDNRTQRQTDRWSLLPPKLSDSADTIWYGWPTITHYRAMRGNAGDADLVALFFLINRFFAGNSPLNMG